MCTDERREGLAAMTTQDTGFDLELTRRKLLAACGDCRRGRCRGVPRRNRSRPPCSMRFARSPVRRYASCLAAEHDRLSHDRMVCREHCRYRGPACELGIRPWRLARRPAGCGATARPPADHDRHTGDVAGRNARGAAHEATSAATRRPISCAAGSTPPRLTLWPRWHAPTFRLSQPRPVAWQLPSAWNGWQRASWSWPVPQSVPELQSGRY